MPKKLQEITATVKGEKFRFGEAEPFTVILDAATEGEFESTRIVIKAQTEGDDPQQHFSYRFYGAWNGYTNKRTDKVEQQFVATSFVRAAPHTRAGIVKYLDGAPNIGRTFALRLWEKFGPDAVKVLREKPDVAAAAIDRLGVAGAHEASEWLKREQALEGVTIELTDLLDGRGFPKKAAKEAVKLWGNRAPEIIKANPYLMMKRIRGVGFKRCDALYLDLGLPPAKLKRQALCAWHGIAQQSEGHTWMFRGIVDQHLKGSIGGADVRSDQAIMLADRGGILAVQRTDGQDGPMDWDGNVMFLAEGTKARNEQRLAGYVCEALADSARWPCPGMLVGMISDHQIKVVGDVLGYALTILGGGPGTGKTFTSAAIIKLLGETIGLDQIGVCAPTGKAAVRVTEAMDAYDIPLTARTIHSLLKVESVDGGGWSFAHGRSNPLPYKVIVVDEASMVDTDLAASLFAARGRGTLMLIIGDVNQLPPVGHGAPLRDMIAAGVPYGELREIMRNDGGIVQACADIRDGKPFRCEGNLSLVAAFNASVQREEMLAAINAESRAFGIDPVWDVQVLCAVNKKSELSRKDLNRILQDNLNPNPAVKGSPFRLADKVVNLKNGWFPLVIDSLENAADLDLNAKGQVYVANGELGEVMSVQTNFLHVRLSAPKRLVLVPRGAAKETDDADDGEDSDDSAGTGCNWDLGYALSTHKSQGSEWPVVIVMVDDSGAAKRVCSREWLYTAISRAKKKCVLIGKLGVAQVFCKRTAIDKRKTFLAQKIIAGRSKF